MFVPIIDIAKSINQYFAVIKSFILYMKASLSLSLSHKVIGYNAGRKKPKKISDTNVRGHCHGNGEENVSQNGVIFYL